MTVEEGIAQIHAVGKSTEQAERKALMTSIPRLVFHDLSNKRYEIFEFLASASFEDAFAFMRGLTLCEVHKISPFPGSVSLVNPAFFVVQRRPVREWAAIADWIILHSANDYIPFNFRATRSAWEAVRESASTPEEIWNAVLEHESQVRDQKNIRAAEHAQRMREQEESARSRLERRHRELEAWRTLTSAHSPFREHRLSEMMSLKPSERLTIIARDVLCQIGYFPNEFAIVTDEDLRALSAEVIDQLKEKCADRRKGPWRDLYLRLDLLRKVDDVS